MAIIKTITWDYEFAEWVKHSDSYSNNFTFEGAKALQAYLDELSDDLGENIEFDPIAWCVEYSEYKDVDEAFIEHHGEYDSDTPEYQGNRTVEQRLEWFRDNTEVIEFDGGIIVRDF